MDEIDPSLLEFFEKLAELGIIESNYDYNNPEGPDYQLSDYSYRVADILNRMIILQEIKDAGAPN